MATSSEEYLLEQKCGSSSSGLLRGLPVEGEVGSLGRRHLDLDCESLQREVSVLQRCERLVGHEFRLVHRSRRLLAPLDDGSLPADYCLFRDERRFTRLLEFDNEKKGRIVGTEFSIAVFE